LRDAERLTIAAKPRPRIDPISLGHRGKTPQPEIPMRPGALSVRLTRGSGAFYVTATTDPNGNRPLFSCAASILASNSEKEPARHNLPSVIGICNFGEETTFLPYPISRYSPICEAE
jgi:hypothetical protein